MKLAKWILLAISLLGCGDGIESYNLTIIVRTAIPPSASFSVVESEVYAKNDNSEPIVAGDYMAQADDDFRDRGVEMTTVPLTQGVYRVILSLFAEDGALLAKSEQLVALSADYELTSRLGSELCNPYEAPLLSDVELIRACDGNTWFECAQAVDAFCNDKSGLNSDSCWIGGVGFAEDKDDGEVEGVRAICFGYAGAVRLTASLATLSAALGVSGSNTPLTETSVITRRGAQAVHTHCVSRGFAGGVGPLLVDVSRNAHFICADPQLAIAKNTREKYFDDQCGYSEMPESQACSETASTFCKLANHTVGFGPITAPEESNGVIEALCL